MNIGDSVFEKCFSSVIDKKKKKMIEAGGEVVASSSNLTSGEMNGSIEKKMGLIRSSLKDSLLFGKWPRVLATYDDYVFVEAEFDGPKALTRFFKVPYTIESDTVKLGAATEIEKVTKFVVKEMREEIIKGLFVEGGAGSGNYGHKGRPGHRGGSLGGGGKGKGGGGVSAHVSGGGKGGMEGRMAKALTRSFNASLSHMKSGAVISTAQAGGVAADYVMSHGGDKAAARAYFKLTNRERARVISKAFPGKVLKVDKGGYKTAGTFKELGIGGGGGTAPHVVGMKGGQKVKAAQFFDKSGNIKTSGYKKLTDNQKGQVLKHGLQKYTESYVPKAKQEGMSSTASAINRKVGEIEGIRRAVLTRANKEASGSKEWRAGIHAAISLQVRVKAELSKLKGAGQQFAGKVIGAGRMAIARSQAATR